MKHKQQSWRGMTIGLVLFSLVVGWMFIDIMSRENVVGSRADVLVMGTNAGFKPFEYIENSEIVGFDVELAREIAKSMGKELKIEDMAFDGLLPALDSGQVDMVVAGMSVTPERAKNALFSSPYYSASQRIIVRRDGDIKNKYQLSGRRIGVQLGTTGDTLVSKMSGVSMSQFQTAPSALQELNARKVDAVVLDNAPAEQYSKGFADLMVLAEPLSKEDYAIAIKKDNENLLIKVNQAIAQMKADGRYDALVKKYFPEEVNS